MATETAGDQLLDIGTRWQHLAGVRETWANALANLERIQPAYLSVGDKKLMEKLAVAIELMDKQVSMMARYDIKKTALMREINAIPPNPKEENADQDGTKANS